MSQKEATAEMEEDEGATTTTEATLERDKSGDNNLNREQFPVMGEEQCIIKWDNYNATLFDSFQHFQKSGYMTDVIISTGNGDTIQCHKIILAAASDVFETMFTSPGEIERGPKLSFVHLQEIQGQEMQLVMDYMYKGAVLLNKSTIQGFLRAADILKIKGIIKQNEKSQEQNYSNKRKRIIPVASVSQYKRIIRPTMDIKQIKSRPDSSEAEEACPVNNCGSFKPLRDVKKVERTNSPQEGPSTRYKRYSEKQLNRALEAMETGVSGLIASRTFGIPARTLYSRWAARKMPEDKPNINQSPPAQSRIIITSSDKSGQERIRRKPSSTDKSSSSKK